VEEITPEDIKIAYIGKQKKRLEAAVGACITIINGYIVDEQEQICKLNYVWIPWKLLTESSHGFAENDLMVPLRKIYKSWNLKFAVGSQYLALSPKVKINYREELGTSVGEGVQKEITPDEVITNRAEILDLGDEQ